ncbi:hypothetical protein [uncultured Psychroserpens sp.]|uniref:hypothetical protein n=1 Tax=uncultured Psychroserpens sp. TaxID=255436 RepID=UPI002613CE83|nr:hypothetical protein [uncultured Psychroserpens sp.]
MNPITTYYLFLYLMVLVINFFRVRKKYQIPDENTPNPENFNWKPVFHISLDIVYTSAGFIVLLIQNLEEWVPALLVFYLILVLISSNLDSISEKLGEDFKLTAHILIVLIIIFTTYITFNTDFIISNKNKYDVAIPYVDKTVIDKVGYNLIGEKEFIFVTQIETEEIDSVKVLAIKKFWDSKDSKPLDKETIIENPILINEKNIIIKQKNNN